MNDSEIVIITMVLMIIGIGWLAFKLGQWSYKDKEDK